MITVHHLNNSRSQRILWMLEELGVDYTIQRYERNPETQLAPESLKQVHPLGKSPVITDGDNTIAESGVIIDYLGMTYSNQDNKPSLRPNEASPDFWQYQYWLHYGEGTLMPLMVMRLIFDRIKTAPMPFFVKPIAKGIVKKVNDMYLGPNITNNMGYIEQHLGQHQWFAGDNLTGADIQMSFPLEASATRAEGSYPNIQAYVRRIHERPAYQRALEKGGPYDYA